VSHQPEECSHIWTSWEQQERKLFTSSDDIIYVSRRECVKCGHVEDGSKYKGEE
jgi:hypothetical protein